MLVLGIFLYVSFATAFLASLCREDARYAPIHWSVPAVSLLIAYLWPLTLSYIWYQRRKNDWSVERDTYSTTITLDNEPTEVLITVYNSKHRKKRKKK
jgi:uncharacterized protein (DUF58 family)